MYKKNMRLGEFGYGSMWYSEPLPGCRYGSCGYVIRKGNNIDEKVLYSYKTPIATIDFIKCQIVVSGYRGWSRTTQRHLRAFYSERLTQEQENIVRNMSYDETATFKF